MEESEKQALISRAKKCEGKQLFVKAAEYYIEAGMESEAAFAYEKAAAYLKAEEIYGRLGRAEDAARCKKLREETTNQPTWADLQADFQKDRGNPD